MRKKPQTRVVDIDDAPGVVRDPRREIGGEVNGDRIREHAAAVNGNAEQLADLRVRAVGGDEIFAAQRALGAGVDMLHRETLTPSLSCSTPITSAPCRTAAPGLARALAQDGLETRLIEEQAPARARAHRRPH